MTRLFVAFIETVLIQMDLWENTKRGEKCTIGFGSGANAYKSYEYFWKNAQVSVFHWLFRIWSTIREDNSVLKIIDYCHCNNSLHFLPVSSCHLEANARYLQSQVSANRGDGSKNEEK